MFAAPDLSLLGFAFVAGAFTFFAPCAYPLLPGYVSFFLGRSLASDPEGSEPGAAPGLVAAARVGTLASLGFFLVYGALAAVVATVGAAPLADVAVLELLVGSLLVVVGLRMALGGDWSVTVPLPRRRRSPLGFFAFGVGYAVAAAGCTAPLFVGVVLAALSRGGTVAGLALVTYAAGMAALLLSVTVAAALGRDALLSRLRGRSGQIHRLSGVLLALAGVAQIYLYLFEFGGLAALGL